MNDQIVGNERLTHPCLASEYNTAYLDIWREICLYLDERTRYNLFLAFPGLMESDSGNNDRCVQYEQKNGCVCHECFVRFKKPEKLYAHGRECHNEQGNRLSRARVIDYFYEFKLHVCVENTIKQKCSLCNYVGVSDDFLQHQLDNHFELWCERCLDSGIKMRFRGLLAWKVHHIHIHRSFMIENECFVCNARYASGDGWRLHALREHMTDSPSRKMISSGQRDLGNVMMGVSGSGSSIRKQDRGYTVNTGNSRAKMDNPYARPRR